MPVSPAVIGPCSVISCTTSSSRAGLSLAIRRMAGHGSTCARCIRHRSSGCISIGMREAACAQYSNISGRLGFGV